MATDLFQKWGNGWTVTKLRLLKNFSRNKAKGSIGKNSKDIQSIGFQQSIGHIIEVWIYFVVLLRDSGDVEKLR